MKENRRTETEVAVICWDCGYQIPLYAGKPILRKPELRTDEFTCSTCGAVYRVAVQQTKPATLDPGKLEAARNKNS